MTDSKGIYKEEEILQKYIDIIQEHNVKTLYILRELYGDLKAVDLEVQNGD